jgi:hypothetical protein
MTAAFTNICVPVWRDRNDKETEQFLTPQDQTPWSMGPITNYIAAASAISRCSLVGAHISWWAPGYHGWSEGPYNTVRDKVTFFCRSADGSVARVNVPGPLETIFSGNSSSVDFANPLVTAVVEGILADLAVAEGQPIVEVYRGLRSRVRNYTGPL